MLNTAPRLVRYSDMQEWGSASGQKASSAFLSGAGHQWEAYCCEPTWWYLAELARSAWSKP